MEYELLRETEKGVFTPTGETLNDDLAAAETRCLDLREQEGARFALVPYTRVRRVKPPAEPEAAPARATKPKASEPDAK